MAQILLFPDPRPLVERLGADFFRSAPSTPGVYLMRDHDDCVLYVGKAKNLRKRLASYRVANPDRLRKRHLRLLRAVERIELRPCATESAALENEAALLRSLRPRFNRAGTWPGLPRFFSWHFSENNLKLRVTQTVEPEWRHCGPLGASATHLHATLARVLWFALYPETRVSGLPEGWFYGRPRQLSTICLEHVSPAAQDECRQHLHRLFSGEPDLFFKWIAECTSRWTHAFDLTVRDADLEELTEFTKRWDIRRTA